MPPKIKSEKDREELRQRILDAARSLFVEKGIDAVSMREIAKQIGYSATTLYNYFADKEALLEALCDTDFLALATGMQEIMQIPCPILRIQSLCKGYAQFALQHPSHYRFMFMTPRPPTNMEITVIEHGNTDQDPYAQLQMVVKTALDAGLFREELQDSELVAQTIWAGVHGVCSLEIALGKDIWMEWAAIEARLGLMQEVMMLGLLRQPNGFTAS